jgi:hypothetical protein
MAMLTSTCRCGATFQAREADVKRGWGKFCSKSCKAREQERRMLQNRSRHYARECGGTPVFNRRGEYEGFIPTPFDNTEHQDSD